MLNDTEIWSRPNSNGHFYFGHCAILDSRNQSNYCDYYVKKNDVTGEGLPDGVGSGCLKAPI